MDKALQSYCAFSEEKIKTPWVKGTLSCMLERWLNDDVTVVKDSSDKYIDVPETVFTIINNLLTDPVRKDKYEVFIKNTLRMKWFWEKVSGYTDAEERFILFITEYASEGLLDDIADGDVEIPNYVGYIRTRITNVMSEQFDSTDPIDSLNENVMYTSKQMKVWESIKPRKLELMNSLLFDAERRESFNDTGEYRIFSKDQLNKHFFKLDIEGTIGITNILYGYKDSLTNIDFLTPLGRATRRMYNIRDIIEDLKLGLCNISQEDCALYEITQEILNVTAQVDSLTDIPKQIKDWINGEKEKMCSEIEAHKSSISLSSQIERETDMNSGFRRWIDEQLMKRIILPKAYINECEKFF